MEFYNMEQLSKMTEEEKENVARAAESDLDQGIREPAVSVLRTLTDMGQLYAIITFLDFLTGRWGDLQDLPGAKAVLSGVGQRLKPADRAYFAGIVAFQEFSQLLRERGNVQMWELYNDPQLYALCDTFYQATMTLYEARDTSGLNYFFDHCDGAIVLMFNCGNYNLHWGELAQICCWLMEDAPEGITFDPSALLTGTLKDVARQAALHPYLDGGGATLCLMILNQSGKFDSFDDMWRSWIPFCNKSFCPAFLAQYRIAEELPLSGEHAQLLQDIHHHLCYLPDFEDYNPNLFPKKKLFGNPAPNTQWYTYLDEIAKYE